MESMIMQGLDPVSKIIKKIISSLRENYAFFPICLVSDPFPNKKCGPALTGPATTATTTIIYTFILLNWNNLDL